MMESDPSDDEFDDTLLVLILIRRKRRALDKKKRKCSRRRFWVRNIFMDREKLGEFYLLAGEFFKSQ